MLNSRSKWNRKVVSQSVNNHNHCFVERFWMPAPSLCVPFAVSAMKLHGRDGAFGLVIQDESGEEEAAREEVDTKNVEQAER